MFYFGCGCVNLGLHIVWASAEIWLELIFNATAVNTLFTSAKVRPIFRSCSLWIDRLMIEPSNFGPGSVWLKSWIQSTHSWPWSFCLINKHWSFLSTWSIPAVKYGLESGLFWERRWEPGGGGRGRGCLLTLQTFNPPIPPPFVLLCAALPFVIQSIIFDQNCQLHSCHTLSVCLCVPLH